MSRTSLLLASFLLAAVPALGHLQAQEKAEPQAAAGQESAKPRFARSPIALRETDKPRQEYEAGYDYGFGSAVKYGDQGVGTMDSQRGRMRYVASVPVAEDIAVRAGLSWERFSFGGPGTAPVPNTMQELALIIGTDVQLSDTWGLRFDLKPGIWSDWEDVGESDLNLTGLLGASWRQAPGTLWLFGLSFNPWSEIPVMPAVGVIWDFAERWTLNAVFPNPRLQYEVREDLDVYIGGSWVGGTYRVAEDFGTKVGNSNLNDALVSYRELRAGAGAKWEFSRGLFVEGQVGYIINRRIEYDRANELLTGTAAPYTQVGISARF